MSKARFIIARDARVEFTHQWSENSVASIQITRGLKWHIYPGEAGYYPLFTALGNLKDDVRDGYIISVQYWRVSEEYPEGGRWIPRVYVLKIERDQCIAATLDTTNRGHEGVDEGVELENEG